MTTTRELELSQLSRVATESELTIEELASLPVYVGITSSPDCIYDGELIELSHNAYGQAFAHVLPEALTSAGRQADQIRQLLSHGQSAERQASWGVPVTA